jgi:hypothetical protein
LHKGWETAGVHLDRNSPLEAALDFHQVPERTDANEKAQPEWLGLFADGEDFATG